MARLAEMTWDDAREALPRSVAVLPVGATEAHGPHLPLATDVILAEAMAREGAKRLEARGVPCVVLPPFAYSAAPFGAAFPGTVSIRPDVATALLVDVARGLAQHGAKLLAIASAHLDPAHIGSLEAAATAIRAERLLRVVFPDITKKPWALRLTDEFQSGACHAGQFEGSIVMAERPDLVKEGVRRSLVPNPASLSRAIRAGKRTFQEAGGPQAYFGNPAAASGEEGRRTIEALAKILEEAVMAERGSS
ncbi:MAG: creatininase family protein [Planctomycetales bacterium]|nr:creatininase family protein [Planctomycetales bacterium]